ncbi:hypothetical protein [Paenibacillus sp. OV219]|uniref:hypothetical protein n=1 Tax=Paenibacillus sp. OV219 TaxID=1884377 RepID=UPI0008AC6A1E|nr:hypothetical protein [Paenibacillus sp. OV219]SEM76911.1 hypothetical protein SAMN05518847_101744 [Paenibacillus sp. OV219]
MGDNMKKGLWMALYSAGCGLMLSIFPFMKSGINMIFSVLAIVIAIFFFKRSASLRSRIVFVVFALFFFIFFTLAIAVILYTKNQSLPSAA